MPVIKILRLLRSLFIIRAKLSKNVERRLLKDLEKLRSPQGYLWGGIPHYKTLFGRDALYAGLMLLDYDSSIARAALQELAKYQGKKIDLKSEEEPGKILHEYRTPADIKKFLFENIHFKYWKFPYYGSVESTMFFIILAEEYFKKTKDKKFIKALWPNIKRGLLWMEKYGDKDADEFIEFKRLNPHGLFHQGWRDSPSNIMRLSLPTALVQTQGYAYMAYQSGGRLAKFFNDKALAVHFSKKARDLKKRFNKEFWRKGMYILALDGDKKPNYSACSDQGHLLMSGIIDSRVKEKKLVQRLFKSDLWTPYGIRTLSINDPYFNARSYIIGSVWFHDNWFIFYGLKMRGYKKEAQKIKVALLRAYQELGSPYEHYAVEEGHILRLPRADKIHACSVAALLNLVQE